MESMIIGFGNVCASTATSLGITDPEAHNGACVPSGFANAGKIDGRCHPTFASAAVTPQNAATERGATIAWLSAFQHR
jgi:hypothetical protein